MVKFGKHVQFLLDYEETVIDHYVVPYNEIRDLVESNEVFSQEMFCEKWRECISNASSDFVKSTQSMWTKVFEVVSQIETEESRGAPIETALDIYVTTTPLRESHDLLALLKSIHSSAALNSEALRKLVKKYDKVNDTKPLSPQMLPELYSSVLSTGISTSIQLIKLLREIIASVADENGNSEGEKKVQESKLRRSRSEELLYTMQDEEQVERRASEIEWLQKMTSVMPPTSLANMVAHRGFHNPTGRADVRPIENSLSAFEMAWNAGIHNCECDIALTKDEKLILAHDEDFTRLAILPKSKQAVQKVSDLTLKELMALPLKNGVRPPLLIDVLGSALSIGDHAKLIIEIKPGNVDACMALAHLFSKFPKLMSHVSVVMSFDSFKVIKLRHKLVEIAQKLDRKGTSFVAPKLLLVTDIESHRKPNEMWVDINSDIAPIDGWLQSNNGEKVLDGIYLRFQKEMLTEKGANILKELSRRYTVGVWVLLNEDPDNYETMKWLVDNGGVTFFNTDLPRTFSSGSLLV